MSRKPAVAQARLARWFEANEKHLIAAGAGAATPADRRLLRGLVAAVIGRLRKDGRAGAEKGASRAADSLRRTLLLGALRDRTFALLETLPAREARTLGRAAGPVFDSLLSEHPPRTPAGTADAGEALARLLIERIFEDSEQAILVHDSRGKILRANRATARWYGYSGRQILKMKLTDFIAPPYRDQFKPWLAKLLREGHRVTEAVHARRDGTRFDVEVSSWVLNRGDRPRIVSMLRDITERRRAVERFRKVFEEGPLGMALVGRDNGFIRVNRTLCRLLGYSESELTGKPVVRVTHPEDGEAKFELFRRAFAGEIPSFVIETRYRRKDGETLWVNLTASVLRDAQGRPQHGLVMVEDISERKRMSAELERRVDERTRALMESHRRSETILRTAIDGYFVLDSRGRYIEVNNAYCAMTGYDRDEILGMGLADLEAIAPAKSIAASLRRLRKAGGDRFETRHRRKDGSQVNLEISANFLPDEEGGRFIVFARDITARKRDLKALKDSEEKFRTIFEKAPILVDSFDRKGRCLLWNKECEKTLGWTEQEILDSPDPLALAYPDPVVRARALRTIRRADGRFREYEVTAKDGSTRVQLWADFRLPNGSIISTGLDITDRKMVENALREARDDLERRVEERTAELRKVVGALELEVAVRHRAEAELRDSEAKLTALIENATEAIWSIDTERRIIAFNSFFHGQFKLAFGVDAEVGKTLDDLLTAPAMAATRDYLRSQLDRALAGESFAVNTAYKVGGKTRYYIVSLQPIVAGWVICGATVYAKDITELRLAEKALARQVGFEKLIARISQAFVSVTPENLDACIREMLHLVGDFAGADRTRLFLFSPDPNVLKRVYEWCAEGVASNLERVLRMPADLVPRSSRELLRTGVLTLTRLSDLGPAHQTIAREFEREGIRSLLAVPLISKGVQIGFLGLHSVRKEREWTEETVILLRIIAEITANAIERTRAQQELKDLSRQHQLILDSAGEGIFGIDANGAATFMNPAAARMLGWQPEEVIGKPIHPIFHHSRPDGKPCPPEECPMMGVFADGQVRHVEDCAFWRRDGTSFPVEFISTPIRESGRIVGAVVTFKDVTERKRGEEALRGVVEGTSSALGEGFFRSLVQHLAAALGVRFAFVSELSQGREGHLQLLAFWEGAGFGECFEYPVRGTPCEHVLHEGLASYPSGVKERFPEDLWLRGVGAESYFAMSLHDARGLPIGHLGVMNDRPFEDDGVMAPILRIFAARAGAELERKQAEEALAHQLEFEKVIGAVSKRFVNVDPESTGAAINDALGLIGYFSGVDRAYLFKFSDDLSIMDNSNEWCADGISSESDRLRNHPTRHFPWAMERLWRHETLHVARVADLPPEAAAEKAEFEAQGIKSLISVPVIYRNAVIGFVGFDAVRAEKIWSQKTQRLLELFAEIMANALARDRAEREFKELSHQNQLILDGAAEGIFGLDIEGNVSFVNPAAARMLGWNAGEISGRSLHAVVHGGGNGRASHAPETCPIEASLRTRSAQRVEEDLFRRKDGSAFPVEFTCTPLIEDDRTIGAVATFNDITLRKRAEELRYHAQLLSQVPDAVLVIDEEGRINFWSKGAENLTGYPAAEVIGVDLGVLLAEGDPGGGLAAILDQTSGAGAAEDYQGEHLVQRKDGQIRLIGMHLSPSPDPDGEGRNWIGVAQDITEARGLQEEIIQAQRLAEVGTLAAGVAHEINNPLTVLSGNIQMMLERTRADDANRKRYEQMKRVCDRISEVVNGLSRISAPRGEQWVLANANDVIEETLALVDQLFPRKDVRIVHRYAEDLPKLRLLQNGLQQLILNLITNALDAIEGEGEIIVETSPGPDSFLPRRGFLSSAEAVPNGRTPEGPSVRIRITDTGCGIPKQHLSRIFLPFFTTKEPGKGTGLGLAVARSIVSIHRGSIEVESEVGRGTTFTVTLPAS